jgi:hypothetical protein
VLAPACLPACTLLLLLRASFSQGRRTHGCCCSDGYATAVLHPGAAALSVDFLAASAAAAPRMGAAAAAFCARLQAAYPGTRVTASTVARLPTQ